MIKARILNRGAAAGVPLVLTEPVSFWGAFDPRTGVIVDTHHAQCGACVTNRMLLLPETRGSGGTPGGIAEAIRRGTGPLGIILIKPDVNLAIGAAVAARLYGKDCPVVTVGASEYVSLCASGWIDISVAGEVSYSAA